MPLTIIGFQEVNNVGGRVRTLMFDPNDSSVFYIGTGESYVAGDVNGGGVWKSSDSGATWTKIFGGISSATSFEPTSDITANPTWDPSFNGMSNVKVLDLDVRDDNMVFAATYGRGVFSGMFTATSLSVNDEDVLANSALKLFPTVSNGQFTLMSAKTLGVTKVDVYSITGKRVHETTADIQQGFRKQFDLSLSAGLYLMRFKGVDFETTKRIIIN